MYAITSVSSSAYQMARATQEVEAQMKNQAARSSQAAPIKHMEQTNIAGAATVSAPTSSTPNLRVAHEASQATPVTQTNGSNNLSRQRFSRSQQQRINEFNLEVITNSPQNTASPPPARQVSQTQNIKRAQKPTPILTESPYLIVVLNQNMTQIQKPTTGDQTKKTIKI